MLLDSELRNKPSRSEPELRFVQEVKVQRRVNPVRFTAWVLGVFWSLILLKCVLAHWAIVRWDMPVGSFWIWFPTLIFAALCTVVFLARPRGQDRWNG